MQYRSSNSDGSLTCRQAALCVGRPGWGTPAQPQSRKIAFALSHLYTSKHSEHAARKLVNVADRAQTRYKGGYSDPQSLVVTPTLSLERLGGVGNVSADLTGNLHGSPLKQSSTAL